MVTEGKQIGVDFETTYRFIYRYCTGKRTQQFIKDGWGQDGRGRGK